MDKQVKTSPWKNKRVKTPTVLQMEINEDGPAALAMILAHHGRIVRLEEACEACAISRDGVKTAHLISAAESFGLLADEIRATMDELRRWPLPMIVIVDFNHHVVLEGIKNHRVYLNDPRKGPRSVSSEEFANSYTNVALTFQTGPNFVKGGKKPSLLRALKQRLGNTQHALTYVILAGLFLVVPGLIVPTFFKVFVDDILVQRMQGWLTPLLIAMTVVVLFSAILGWLQKYYLLRLETKLVLGMSARFLEHVFSLPIQFFHRRFGGEIVNRIMINERLAQVLSGELTINVLSVVMIVFYAALMFQYDALLTIIGIGVVCINLFALRFFSQRRIQLVHQLLQDQGKSLATAMTGLQLIETLKANGSESDFFEQWAGYQAKVKNAEQDLGAASQTLNSIPSLLSNLNNVVILAFGSLKIMNGQMSIGELVAFQSLMYSFVGPVNQIVNLGSQLQEVRSGLNRVDEVLAMKPDLPFLPGGSASLSPRPNAVKLEGELELRNVTFGYNRLEPPLIHDFNLKLSPGSRVALVGATGSGKSTIAKLITGLYQPWSGEILFDGQPREKLPRSMFTYSLALVDQDIFLFEGTIFENLTMWDNTISKELVVQAAKDACIHNDITERPGGYSSLVAEGCSNFSGGQQQRLEIARALVNNPSILILDEATSALDPYTEKLVDDNIRRQGCTCLIIAHRLSTIRDCDEIVVLERGQVVQRGIHEEMKGADGPYAQLIASD